MAGEYGLRRSPELDYSLLADVANEFGDDGLDFAFLEKDWYATELIALAVAYANSDDSKFQLLFGGGTSLSKAHKLIQRFSEDVGTMLS